MRYRRECPRRDTDDEGVLTAFTGAAWTGCLHWLGQWASPCIRNDHLCRQQVRHSWTVVFVVGGAGADGRLRIADRTGSDRLVDLWESATGDQRREQAP